MATINPAISTYYAPKQNDYSNTGNIAYKNSNTLSNSIKTKDSVTISSEAQKISDFPLHLYPTQENIDSLNNKISDRMPQFLTENNIPEAPTKITYDNYGKIHLPQNYEYSSEFKQALEADSEFSDDLRNINAMTSHFVGIQKAIASGYSQKSFSDQISLQFSEMGILTMTVNEKDLSLMYS